MPSSLNLDDAGLRRSARVCVPSQCAKESAGKYKAIVSNKRILRTMSFASLLRNMSFASVQLRTYSDCRRLEDGMQNELHAMAFASQVADMEMFHYGDAMKQPDKFLFIKAMVKEVKDLFDSDVVELKKRLEMYQPEVPWKACGYENGKYVADLFEDNKGAYELAKAPKMRPCTKHIALKYHHFGQHVINGTIRINPIGTKDQIADIFTKGLACDQFEFLRKPLCGW